MKTLLKAGVCVAIGAWGMSHCSKNDPESAIAAVQGYYAERIADREFSSKDAVQLDKIIDSAYVVLEKGLPVKDRVKYLAQEVTQLYGHLGKAFSQADLSTAEGTVAPNLAVLNLTVDNGALYTGFQFNEEALPLRLTDDDTLIVGERNYARHACWEDGKQGIKDYLAHGKEKITSLFGGDK